MSVAVTGQSETTRRDYATTARAFIGMVGRVLDQRAPSPVDVVDFFLGQHGRWSESTIRHTRAALRFAFVETSRKHPNHPLLVKALQRLNATDCETGRLVTPIPCERTERQTSAKKRKTLTPAEAHAVLLALCEVGHRHAPIAQAQVFFGIDLGLRPVEWETAQIADGYLVIQNAKNTNDRGNGPTRRLPLDGFGEDYVASLAASLDRIADALVSETWEAIHQNVARAMTAASIKAGKTCPSLRTRPVCPYTLRHVATARMKVDLPPEVIAAILGHRSIHTASRNYAPARSAKGFRPIVTTADPIAVAQVNSFRKDIAKIESADVHSSKAGL
ncbi:hypothetical protein [Methylobacterium fujisawaense]